MNNIKALRKACGFTLKELADLCEVSESTIQRIESGTRKPSFEVMLKLGEALNCPASDIFTGRNSAEFSVSLLEMEFIRKYRSLDKHGKSIVDYVLNEEAARCDNIISLDDVTMVARSGKPLLVYIKHTILAMKMAIKKTRLEDIQAGFKPVICSGNRSPC